MLYEVRCYFKDGDKVRYLNVTDVDSNDIRVKIVDIDENIVLIMVSEIKYIEMDVMEGMD